MGGSSAQPHHKKSSRAQGAGCRIIPDTACRPPLVGDAGPVIGDRYSALVDENADYGVGGISLDRVVGHVADGVINRGGVDVHQAGVQFGVDGRGWHALPYATHLPRR